MDSRSIGKWLMILTLLWLVAYSGFDAMGSSISDWILYSYVGILFMACFKVYLNYRQGRKN